MARVQSRETLAVERHLRAVGLDDADDVLRAITMLLTFVRGAWSPDLVPVGLNESGDVDWHEWVSRRCDPWHSPFPGGVGNTWDDPDRFRRLFESVRERLFDALPDDTWVYPGHGDDTTLGTERPNLPEWEKRGW